MPQGGSSLAQVIGVSGLWHAIRAEVVSYGLSVSSPDDVTLLTARLDETRDEAIRAHRVQTMSEVGRLSSELAALRAQRGLLAHLANAAGVRRRKAAIQRLYRDDAAYPGWLDAVRRRVEWLGRSPELAGARAELQVASLLSRLPGDHVVLNDVRLRANRRIRFNGKGLCTAQLDHVVLSNAGVWVIETKNWTREFADIGRAQEPFEQVERAAYLCYDLLRRSFGAVPVHGVVACAGVRLAPPADSRVVAVPAGELVSLLTGPQQQAVAPDRLARIQEYLSARVFCPTETT